MSQYLKKLRVLDDQIDRDFWRQPDGVAIPFDDLKFLYIPDQVEALMVADIARQVYEYQIEHIDDQITKAVMITMGALLPGVLLLTLWNGYVPARDTRGWRCPARRLRR